MAVQPDPAAPSAAPTQAEPEDFPWHDPAMELPERMTLAEGRPLAQRLMAAMGQLDCGQCGYLCQSYAEALATGAEASPSLCVPGAKATTRMVKQLLAEAPALPGTACRRRRSARRVRRDRPAAMSVCDRPRALTRPGSSKDVRHVVIDLGASGLNYEPGDSIGLATPADPALVQAMPRRARCYWQRNDRCGGRPRTILARNVFDRGRHRPPAGSYHRSAGHERQTSAPRRRLAANSAKGPTAPNRPMPTCSICWRRFRRRGLGSPIWWRRCRRCVRGCIRSPPHPARHLARCICAWLSCAMNGAGGCGTVWPAHFWRIVPPQRAACRPTSRPAISVCPPIRRRPSSWSGPEPGLLRSGDFWRNGRRAASAAAAG